MAHWIALGTQLGKKARTTYEQLTEQMIPFESELTKSHDNRLDRAHGPDLAPVKAISAQACLGMKSCEIGIDRQPGGRVCAKALKLGMMRVPTRSTSQHCFGQQGFPPDSDQSLRVKMPGVQRPETHLSIGGEQLRVPHDLPEVTIRILKIAGVPTPERILCRFDYDRARVLRLLHHGIHLFPGGNVLADRELCSGRGACMNASVARDALARPEREP